MKSGKGLIIITVVVFVLSGLNQVQAACLGLGGGISIPKFSKKTGIYIETDIKPTSRFEEAKIKSVSVLKFDAKYCKTMGGEIIDYVDLSNKFTDNLLKRFYEMGKVDVALGEYEDKIIETDTLEKKRGDLELQGNTLQRSIEFKAVPYKKIETVLGGRINKYQEGEDWKKSFIEVTLRITDTYSGAVYWITEMRGYVKDVVETIVKSISEGKYTEPIPLKAEKVKGAKKEEEKKAEEGTKAESQAPAEMTTKATQETTGTTVKTKKGKK
ncbi:MAG: hypothetical protein PHF84_00450 [bacterium]|nr:hypothetical protein [bacterium]